MSIDIPMLSPRTSRIDLTGKVAIVTGGAGGIGYGIARGLAEAGAVVIVADRSLANAQEAVARIGDSGRAAPAEVDVTDEWSVAALVEDVVRVHGSIDILVNNAAVSTDALLEETSLEDWRKVLDVNLTGPFLCSRAVVPHMAAQGGGRIVSIGSIAAKRISLTHGASYTAAKEGLIGLTRHLAYEVAGRGITANVVCPGATLTPAIAAKWTPEILRAREKATPRGRIAQPEDILRVVLFLVSDLADLVCGQAIDVDAGALLGWQDTETYFRERSTKVARI